MNDYLLAIDPGKTSGWAIFKLPALLFAYGQLRPEKENAWVAFWEKYPAFDGDWHVACEAQFIAGVPLSASGAKKLELFNKQQKSLKIASSAGAWEGVARLHRWNVRTRVHPITWRNAIFGKGRYSAPQAKKLALQIANQTYKLRLRSSQHHVAEAICIGDYVRKQMMMEI